MCEDGCTHGQVVYVPEGSNIFTWPQTDTSMTEAIEQLNIERGRE